MNEIVKGSEVYHKVNNTKHIVESIESFDNIILVFTEDSKCFPIKEVSSTNPVHLRLCNVFKSWIFGKPQILKEDTEDEFMDSILDILVKENILINCHDPEPSTDVVYALANKLQDPIEQFKINYEWFNFIHGKHGINQIPGNRNFYNYLNPFSIDGQIYLGGYRIKRPWHYHEKNLLERIHV
jgi:hypothetical protein